MAANVMAVGCFMWALFGMLVVKRPSSVTAGLAIGSMFGTLACAVAHLYAHLAWVH